MSLFTKIDTPKDNSIQLLRFIAALGIILFHMDIVKGGYFGVDIFFVISGYVMMLSTEKQNNKFFLLKKLIRIVPLYWIATLVMYFVILLMPTLSLMSEAKINHLIKSMLFIPYSNIFPLLSIGWTLNYQVYFYVIFYISLKISHKYRAYITSLIIILLVCCGAISKNFYLSYIGDTVMLEFMLGISIYIIQKKFISQKLINTTLPKYIILASIIIYSYLWYVTRINDISNRWIRMGVPAAILLLLSINSLHHIKMPYILCKAGDITYSVYLIEFFTTKLYKVLHVNGKIVLNGILLIALMTCTYFIATISYHLIECKLSQAILKKITYSK